MAKYTARSGKSVFQGVGQRGPGGRNDPKVGPASLNVGPGRGINQDVLQPGMYSGHQQMGSDPRGGVASFSVGSQGSTDEEQTPGQDGLATDMAKKLGASGPAKIKPGFPAGLGANRK